MRRSTADIGHSWGGGGKYSVISVNPDISQVLSMDPEDRIITGFHCTYFHIDCETISENLYC